MHANFAFFLSSAIYFCKKIGKLDFSSVLRWAKNATATAKPSDVKKSSWPDRGKFPTTDVIHTILVKINYVDSFRLQC
jgi:hypothetical protein